MMTVSGNPVRKEIQEFQFKLLTQLKLFSSDQCIKLDSPRNLISSASKYGFIFAGIPTGVTCFQTSAVVNIQNQRNNNRGYITSFPRRVLHLGVLPSHISVNCDNEMLAVAVIFDSCQVLYIYSITSFGSEEIKRTCEIRLSSTPGVIVRDLQWNPGVSNVIAAVMSDGIINVYEIEQNSFTAIASSSTTDASCFCWSPKGKQLVIGSRTGTLAQYKPDLKHVKGFSAPQVFNQPEVISVHWLSNYQFIAAYKDRINTSSKPAVMIVNAPKGGAINFVNYEDICFGFGTSRPEHYFIHQQLWNVIISGTSNGTEIVVLGQKGDSWEQWLQDESNRAQLPVSEDYRDVYLTGMAIDYTPQSPVPIGENNFISPMPFLLMYSQEGVLCYYHIINMMPNAPMVCHPPQPLPDQSGMQLFTDIQNPQSRDIQITHGENSIQNKPSVFDQSKQAAQIKLPSFGSDLTQHPNKAISSTLTSQSPFSPLNIQKSATSSVPSAGFGGIPAFGGFGLVMENISEAATITVPKFTTTAPLISQPPAASSSLTFQLPITSPQVTSSHVVPSQPLFTQQTPNNKSFNTFQPPSTSVSYFTTSSSNETSATGNSSVARPALSMTPTQINNVLSLISQGVPVTTTKSTPEKSSVNKEITSKDTTNRLINSAIQSKETEALTNQVAAKNIEEKEQPEFEMDFIGAIKEEIAKFSEEVTKLQQLKNSQLKNKRIFSIGHDEVNRIGSKMNDLMLFEKDVKETTCAQVGEVTTLVNSVVELFSWLENVKTKQRQINNPKYMDLMESQDLDPVTKKHITNIEHYIYYLDTQIKQANVQLETLWSQHKGKPMKSFELPNMEAIYQTIVAENYILAAQKVRITELEVRLKEKMKSFSRKIPQLTDFSSPSLKNNLEFELDVLADKLLLSKLHQNDVVPSNSLKNSSANHIMTSGSQKYISPKKEVLLHKWHKNHVVINAKAPKRQTGQVDIGKFAKQVNKSPNIPTTPQSDTDSKIILAKSKFTVVNQIPSPTQNSCGFEQAKETKAGNIGALTPFLTKHDVSGSELRSPPKNEPLKKTDMEIKSSCALSSQTVYSSNTSQILSPFKSPGTWDSGAHQHVHPSASQGDTSVNNILVDLSGGNQLSPFSANYGITNQAITSAPLQSTFNFDSIFSHKSPTTSTTNNSVVTSSASENILSKQQSTTVTDISANSASALSISETKESFTKETQENTPESNKNTITFSLKEGIPFGNTTTSSVNSLEKSASSINIFGSSPSTQNTFSSYNFSKNSVFPHISTTTATNPTTTPGVKTNSIFGTSATTRTSSTASTSIFGGKPILSPQFISPITTGTLTLNPTTSTSLPTSPTTTKPAITSTVPLAGSAPSFFTKPSAMKSLFGTVPSSTSTETIFKTTSSQSGTTIFAASQPQLEVTTSSITSNLVVSSSGTTETLTTPAFSTPTTVSAPAVTTSAISSTGLPSETANSTFSSGVVTSSLETSSNLLVASPTNNVPPSAVSTTSTSSPSTSASVIEKDSVTVSPSTTTFGMNSTELSTVFGGKTTQTNSAFDGAVSSPSPANNTFATVVTTAGFATVTPTESSSIFGNTVAKPSLFSTQSTTPSFGNNPPTTSTSIFGATTTSVFGSPSTKTTTASIFGTSSFGTVTTNASVFGATSALSSASFFGSPTTTSAFGTSIFSPPTTSNNTSFFGQTVCSATPTSTVSNVFNTISFGQKPAAVTTSGTIFGGNRSSFEAKPLFGQSGGGLFGQTTSSPGTFGSSGGSIFGGGASTFGSPQQPTNLFQSPTGTSRNMFSLGGNSGGTFSTGNQSVAQTGFGGLPTFQASPKPFGGASPPAFGTQTSFGAAPTFGGSVIQVQQSKSYEDG